MMNKLIAKLASPRALPYTVTPATGLALVPAAAGLDALWSTHPAQSAVTALAAAGLTAITWREAGSRAPRVRLHYTVNAALAGTYVTAVTIYGPADPAVWRAWAIGLIGTSAIAAARRLVRGEGKDAHGANEDGVFGALKVAARWRGRPEVDGGTVVARGQVVATDQGISTVADVQQAADRLAVHYGTPPGGVTVRPDPDNAQQFEAELVPTDWLADWQPWPGPSAWGHSIAQPIPLGPYRRGSLAQIWLPGDQAIGRNATSYGIFAMTGAGKTETFVLAAAEIVTRHDSLLLCADPVKRGQSLGPVIGGMAWFTPEFDGAKAMVAGLPRLIQSRTEWLGRRGYKEWEAGCGLPFITVAFEEFAAYLSDSERLARIIQQCRSAGISLIISLQRPTHTNMPTDVRQSLGGRIVLGLESGDAPYALSQAAADQGADPEAWGNRKPGYMYLSGPGIPEELFATPARTWRTDGRAIREAVDTAAAFRAEPDPLTLQAFGDLWRVGHAESIGEVVTVAASRADREVAQVDSDVDGGGADELVEVPGNAEPGFLDDVDPGEPVEWPASSIPLGQDRQEPDGEVAQQVKADTREEAEAALAAHLAALAAKGVEEIGPKDLVAFGRTVMTPPRQRPWLSKAMGRLAEAGVLPSGVEITPGDKAGVYRLRALAGVNGA
jgi:hypothetical protein